MERILSKWTFQRALYFLLGVAIVIQAITERQWIGVLFGGYFTSMGLFAFGCAAGKCYPVNQKATKQTGSGEFHDIEFEEIK